MRSAAEDRLDRQHLLTSNTEKIERTYLAAKKDGLNNPVVIVIDARDRVGAMLLRIKFGDAKVDALVAEMVHRGVIPTKIVAAEYDVVLEILGATSPSGKVALSNPMPSGYFWTIAVANGGNSYAGLPFPD